MSPRPPVRENLTTLRAHLEAGKRADGPGDLPALIDAIALAGKAIARRVRRARIEDVVGAAGAENVHGEAQQKLDVLADELLLHSLRARPDVAVYGSEERDEAMVLRPRSDGGVFTVLVDPLDGSSNIDVAVNVGTIFSVLPNEAPDADTAASALQPGSRQLAAGYILYGSSVVLILTTGEGVDLYVLDPELGEFVLAQAGVRMPASKKIYSVNEAYRGRFEPGLQRYLDGAHEDGYSLRYIGSMVADVHRTLLKGGVFLYPAMSDAPEGKLRLLYEGNPMALLAEEAGGAAACGSGRILDRTPRALHERVPVILGSPAEVERVTAHLA
jgi:fructose-1,6-bisphosphatase I